MIPCRWRALACAAWLVLPVASFASTEVSHITATRDLITISGRSDDPTAVIAELAPYQSTNEISDAPNVADVKAQGNFRINIPRWDGSRDRLYSGFVAYVSTNGTRMTRGEIHFVEEMRGLAKYDEKYPRAPSKKGLQVQMVDDALALGIKHAGLNVNLASMIDLNGGADSLTWELDGVTYHFHRGQAEGLDRQIKPLSDAGVIVTLILLDYQSGDPAVARIMLHPDYSQKAPNHLSAFNTKNADGLRWFKACIEFLTDRYSMPGHPHGCAVNFIVGNEVNTHWEWSNLGEAPMEKFADDYLRTVRVCDTAVHKISANSRVFISLEHHWNIRYAGPLHSFPGRAFIDYFNDRARAGGNFGWNLAYHPYPEDLFNPRTWNDKTATRDVNTSPRITFKNLDLLPHYFNRPELLFHGKQRHIILSEQGFNTLDQPDGELLQAAAYCYAYYKVSQLPGIDAFILHRHVDHRDEGGINLGLWRRNKASASPCEPAGKKMIYDVFRLADTPQWRKAFAFALPVIGIHDWKELKPKR